jgi:chromosome segregation ATPase
MVQVDSLRADAARSEQRASDAEAQLRATRAELAAVQERVTEAAAARDGAAREAARRGDQLREGAETAAALRERCEHGERTLRECEDRLATVRLSCAMIVRVTMTMRKEGE